MHLFQKTRRRSLFLSCIFCLAPFYGCGAQQPKQPPRYRVAEADEAYWPRWSGPQSDMISRETGWSTSWPHEGLRVAWEAKLGTGFSSVSVADGRLFTMGYRNGRDYVYCLDARTGGKLWTHDYPCALVDNLHEGGPGSTPTVDKDRVYTLSREGHLFCLQVETGKVLWSKQLQNELGVKMPEWGFTCSPLVVGDMLVLEAGRTVAMDKRTGAEIWRTEPFRPGYGSPRAFRRGEQLLIAVLNNDRLMVVDSIDGRQVASFPWTTRFATTSTTPIAHEDTLFISTGYDEGCALLRWRGDQLKVVYENREMRNHMNNCVLWKGYLYGIDGNSHNPRTCQLVCMDYKTGRVAWKKRGFGCGSVLIANGKLMVLSDRGTLVLAEASPQAYRELGRSELFDARCWTVPVVAGGRVYCRSAKGDLVCVNLPAAESD